MVLYDSHIYDKYTSVKQTRVMYASVLHSNKTIHHDRVLPQSQERISADAPCLALPLRDISLLTDKRLTPRYKAWSSRRRDSDGFLLVNPYKPHSHQEFTHAIITSRMDVYELK